MRQQQEMTLNGALADFYQVKKGNYEKSTWDAIQARLENWRRWIVQETQPEIFLRDICRYDDRYMERYFNRLRPPAYAPSSFNNYRQYLNGFWTYCRGRGYVDTDPMQHVDPLKVPRRVRLQLSADELLRMLETASPRDRIALAIGMNTGLRAGDITALKVGAVNLAAGTIHAYIHKTKKEREIDITAELDTELLRWFEHYAGVQGVSVLELPNTWTLVPPAHWYGNNPHKPALGGKTKYKTGMRYTHPETIVQDALKLLGHEPKGEGFHTLRRSAARVAFDLAIADGIGDPIRIPMSMLDHVARGTTEIYLGVSHDKVLTTKMLRGKSFLGRAVEAEAEHADASSTVAYISQGEVRRSA